MIKLICTDIDGTLVPDGTDHINEELFDVIVKLKEKKIMFAAASGRQYASIRSLFKPVEDDIIYVAESGNLVVCRNQIMDMSSLEIRDVKELTQDIEKLSGCDALLAGPMVSYGKKSSKELVDLMIHGYHYNIEAVDDLCEIYDKDIIKVSLFHKERRAEEAAREMTAKWANNPRIETVCAGKEWIDFFAKGSNKGRAVGKIQEIMGIQPSETMAFGDNLNDIEMLSRADLSFAVGNARKEVKEAARYTADTNVNHGVLKEIKKLLL